ncbi:MAG: YdeI/OmpD-associated family protein [Chthoniobacterales bacterium]|nr:YdeI/OmpD-associated family protein [Chthoniobacterales bacterium]
MDPEFFATPGEFRRWLAANHGTASELWVGFWKKGTGRASITWPESVDEALCFGWIDGVRKRLDAESYVIRFSPRKAGSIWSTVNIARVAELTKQGRMEAAGDAAFARRKEAKSGVYAYEQRQTAKLNPEAERQFRAHPKAWKYFEAQPPWYRRTATWWVISAKREETRQKRLTVLIEDAKAGRTLRQLTRPRNRSADPS